MPPPSSPAFGGTTPPPPGLNYLSTIKPSLTYALMTAMFTSFLVSILIAVIFFSTRESRCRPIFYLNASALLLGIVEGIIFMAIQINAILHPRHLLPRSLSVGWFIVSFYSPLLVDSILYLRLVAVYPPRIARRRTLVMILGFPVLVKIARVVFITLFVVKLITAMMNLGSAFAAAELVLRERTYGITLWSLQLVDNSYSSFLFIYRIRKQTTPSSDAVKREATIASHLRGLLLISVSNFVFPCIFVLTILILSACEPDSNVQIFFDATYIFIVNNYITILGVVFATVWSAGSRWATTKEAYSGLTFSTQPVLGPGPWANVRHSDTPTFPDIYSGLELEDDSAHSEKLEVPPNDQTRPESQDGGSTHPPDRIRVLITTTSTITDSDEMGTIAV